MGLVGGGDGEKVESWDVGKSEGKKKKKERGGSVETGCWRKLRFIGSCISSRSKVDSSISGISTHYGICKIPSFFSIELIKVELIVSAKLVLSLHEHFRIICGEIVRTCSACVFYLIRLSMLSFLQIPEHGHHLFFVISRVLYLLVCQALGDISNAS